MSTDVHAPWSKDQVHRMNRFQVSGSPFQRRCYKHDRPLIADNEGWVCSACGRVVKKSAPLWITEFSA